MINKIDKTVNLNEILKLINILFEEINSVKNIKLYLKLKDNSGIYYLLDHLENTLLLKKSTYYECVNSTRKCNSIRFG